MLAHLKMDAPSYSRLQERVSERAMELISGDLTGENTGTMAVHECGNNCGIHGHDAGPA